MESAVRHYRLPRRLVDRESYLLSICEGKSVLHVGCADFSKMEDLKNTVQSSRWLHKRLLSVADRVTGIDNAEEAVTLLRERYRMDDIYVGDAQHLEKLDLGRFDVVLAGEIIEHLPCPGRFLGSAKTCLNDNGRIIITTANAFCFRKMLQVVRGIESVHADHVAYFSHRTIERLVQLHGYKIIDRCSYRITRRSPLFPYVLDRVAAVISPNLCEGIIVNIKEAGTC